ncbi:hypothetical protein [Serratia nevei]|uniref:hypothetical protein n=1 Tax=Serratia nevei TaxID=2703794 RepID=UPI00313F00E9
MFFAILIPGLLVATVNCPNGHVSLPEETSTVRGSVVSRVVVPKVPAVWSAAVYLYVAVIAVPFSGVTVKLQAFTDVTASWASNCALSSANALALVIAAALAAIIAAVSVLSFMFVFLKSIYSRVHP